jgi:23S rRNA pseudouridine955/2504/2580 synthase
MVFAKSEQAASFLSQAWRERENVSKIYLAKVTHWPPYLLEEKHNHGTIDAPLTPSDERLKWKVCKDGEGKSSTTLWRVQKVLEDDALILELQPVTGRTHQLRIHCAHVGSGIVGDSLYGNDRVEQIDPSKDGTRLHLHAHQLSFPHPATKKDCMYCSSPDWL